MAILTVNTVDRTGAIDPVASQVACAGGGDSFPNTGYEYFIIKNGGGGSITVTLVCQSTVDGQAVTNKTVAVPAGASRIVGPFNTTFYNDANARMNLTYSAVTSVTISVFKNTQY